MSRIAIPAEDRRAVRLHTATVAGVAVVGVVVAVLLESVVVAFAFAAGAVLLGRALTERLRGQVAPGTMQEIERRYSRASWPVLVATIALAVVVLIVLLT